MLRAASFALVASVAFSNSFVAAQETPPKPAAIPQKRLAPFPFESVKLAPGLVSERFVKNTEVTLPLCLAQLESSGRIKNFAVAASREQSKHVGTAASDADVYAIIETASYSLAQKPDAALLARIDGIVDLIAAAQHADGYLNTYYQLVAPDKRFTDMASGVELDCAGHLFEAAVVYQRATKKAKLLEVAKKFADHIDKTFGPGKRTDVGGRSELEAGLCQLFEATGEARYLALAKFFVDQRGAGKNAVAPDAKPWREQHEISGATTSGAAFLAGAAGVSRLLADDTLLLPLEATWKNVHDTRLSITGGISANGATAKDGPSDTCSSIAIAQWSQQMLLATCDAKYADLVEHELNNIVMASVSQSGDKFLAQTTLDNQGDVERTPWFEGSGTPHDIARFMAQVPSMVFATAGNSVYISQFVPCEADVVISDIKVHIKMETDWPLKGLVSIKVRPDAPLTFSIKFRRPGWCKKVTYKHDLKEQEHSSEFPGTEAGWEAYERRYDMEDGCMAFFASPMRREAAPSGAGRVAICRGSVVFALEGVDNAPSAHSRALPVSTEPFSAIMHPDATLISFLAFKSKKGLLIQPAASGTGQTMQPSEVLFMPYYLCANRGKSDFAVWIPEIAVPGESPTLK